MHFKETFNKPGVRKNLRRLLIVPLVIDLVRVSINSFLFFVMLNFYFLPKVGLSFQRFIRIIPKVLIDKQEFIVDTTCKKVVNLFDKQLDIKKWQIIDLAFKSMFAKKTRTAVTIGGMAIGIGATVFLLSIGYGAEKLVKSRVASLNQIKQTDISSLNQKQLPLNNQLVKDLIKDSNVKTVLPMISVVGKVDFNGSAVDVVVYSADSEYLDLSDIKPIEGKFFNSKNSWEKEYDNKDLQTFLLNNKISQFVEQDILESDKAIQSKETTDKINKVLGITDTTSTTPTIAPTISSTPGLSAQDSKLEEALLKEDINFEDPAIYNLIPEIQPETEAIQSLEINLIEGEAIKEAVVTDSFLSALDIKTDKAIGNKFDVKFTLVGELLPKAEGKKVTSKSATYTITSVIAGDKPYIYVPLKDLKTLGVTNYSQMKIIAKDEKNIPIIREKVEGLGYETQSVQDTLERIESLFGGLRAALLFLGVLALSVAALGMFNTLTVSLLERTHEVGLLKSLGMKSGEVKEMFLAESLILGFFGGVAGVGFGFIFGKILDLVLSAISISAGQGPISVTYIPFALVAFTLILSYIIGVVTGFYPAKRATKISALDALRYE